MILRGSAVLFLGIATASCSGRYLVGMDPGAGGSAGTGGSAATGGSASTGSSTGGSIGQAGTSDPGPPLRCAFAPDTVGSTAATASSTVVWSRIHRFLDDNAAAPPPNALPIQPTAAWAADQAAAILDGHVAAKTEAPGLVRFLTSWLKIPTPDAGLSAAHTWSLTLLDSNATLTTLLTAPTGEPHRFGVVTDREFLTAYRSISPRGKWMVNSLFCSDIPPPPPDTGMPSTPTGVTRREKLESILSPPTCKACHNLMDPPGDSLEHFDETGTYRDLDNGKAVDSSGAITAFSLNLRFTSIEDLAPQLAVSCVVAQCFSKTLMSDAFGVVPPAMNPFTDQEVNHVANAFANSNFSIRELVKAIVGTPSFLR